MSIFGTIHALLLASAFTAVSWNAPDRSKERRITARCEYELVSQGIPTDTQNYQPFKDTTITRDPACRAHVLRLPAMGTSTAYEIVEVATGERVLRKSFPLRRNGYGWDITERTGTYRVRMLSCGASGEFEVTIR
jgi:hypothetical protein